jgi:hypothetical protein
MDISHEIGLATGIAKDTRSIVSALHAQVTRHAEQRGQSSFDLGRGIIRSLVCRLKADGSPVDGDAPPIDVAPVALRSLGWVHRRAIRIGRFAWSAEGRP